MSDSIKGLVVTFIEPLHEDHAEAISRAILLIKDVGAVEKKVDNFDDSMNRRMVQRELREKLFEVLEDSK